MRSNENIELASEVIARIKRTTTEAEANKIYTDALKKWIYGPNDMGDMRNAFIKRTEELKNPSQDTTTSFLRNASPSFYQSRSPELPRHDDEESNCCRCLKF